DEPTNDLDLDTLELLESQLLEWSGTLLLVSHDRSFLDNVVTSTLVFEGDGRVQEYVGGYEDWVRQRAAEAPAVRQGLPTPAKQMAEAGPQGPALRSSEPSRKKRSFKEQREFEELPSRIEALEIEERRLNAALADSHFYKEPADTIRQ